MSGHLTQVESLIIRYALLPQGPNDMQPAVGQAAISVTIRHAPCLGTAEITSCPDRFAYGRHSELLGRLPVAMVASLSKPDEAGTTRLNGHWASTGDGGQYTGLGVTGAMVAEHDQ